MEHPSTPPRSSLHGTWGGGCRGPNQRPQMRPFSWGLRREPSSHPCPASPPHSPDSVSPTGGRLWPAPNPGKPDPGPLGPGYTGSMGSSPFRLPWANPLSQHPAPCSPAAGRLRWAMGPEGCPGVWRDGTSQIPRVSGWTPGPGQLCPPVLGPALSRRRLSPPKCSPTGQLGAPGAWPSSLTIRLPPLPALPFQGFPGLQVPKVGIVF